MIGRERRERSRLLSNVNKYGSFGREMNGNNIDVAKTGRGEERFLLFILFDQINGYDLTGCGAILFVDTTLLSALAFYYFKQFFSDKIII